MQGNGRSGAWRTFRKPDRSLAKWPPGRPNRGPSCDTEQASPTRPRLNARCRSGKICRIGEIDLRFDSHRSVAIRMPRKPPAEPDIGGVELALERPPTTILERPARIDPDGLARRAGSGGAPTRRRLMAPTMDQPGLHVRPVDPRRARTGQLLFQPELRRPRTALRDLKIALDRIGARASYGMRTVAAAGKHSVLVDRVVELRVVREEDGRASGGSLSRPCAAASRYRSGNS